MLSYPKEDGGDESSEESINDDEDDDDEDGGVTTAGGGSVRTIPPNNLVGSLSIHNQQQQHQPQPRKSFSLRVKVIRTTVPSGSAMATTTTTSSTWKATDEMIGVSVPRKARSASAKREEGEIKMGGPSRQCQVCNQAQSKYKCPSCLVPYCSLACFKTHKGMTPTILLFSFHLFFSYVDKYLNFASSICFKSWEFLGLMLSHQLLKLYKLKHLSKVEVLTNDPSGCTFTLGFDNLRSQSFAPSYYFILPLFGSFLLVAQPPSDSVSSLSFSPKANFLIATSWDNQVRCWEISWNGTAVGSTPKASITHDQLFLCSAWKDDGMTVFSGGCDKQVKMWPLLSGGQPTTVAMHDTPIKEVAWIPEMNLLATGSWDKTLKYWDTRQSNPVNTQQLPDRCYALTVKYPLMVVGTADRNLIVFNLQNPQVYTCFACLLEELQKKSNYLKLYIFLKFFQLWRKS
ncbi:hypothetical protein GQ457_02G016320 [Hibiscus cannabinus]